MALLLVASIPRPNLESKSGATSPFPSFGLRSPQFMTQVFPSILGFFPLKGESFVKGVDCPVEIGGSVNEGEFFVEGAD